MASFRRILVPVDLSPLSLLAVRYAAALARHDQATLCLLHAVQDLTPLTAGGGDYSAVAAQYLGEAESEAKRALEKAVPAEVTQGLEVFRETVVGAAGERILEFAKSRQIDLICIGTHGRGGLKRMLLGSVAERVVQHAGCPVLVVRQRAGAPADPPDAALSLRRILVPVDFSETNQSAIAEGAELAVRFGAELHLLYVVEDSSPALTKTAATSPVFRSYVQDLTTNGEKDLAAVAVPASVPASSVHRQVAVGDPIDKITAHAREHEIDLVVMSTHGRTGASHWLLGSVAERVVRSAPCPVLVTRSSAKGTS